MSHEESMSMQAPQGHMIHGGHLYMQTNEIRNCIIHYHRAPDGTLTEAGRILTGGAGSGIYKPVSGQESAPNAFEGANSLATRLAISTGRPWSRASESTSR